jgi:hypothetical protein
VIRAIIGLPSVIDFLGNYRGARLVCLVNFSPLETTLMTRSCALMVVNAKVIAIQGKIKRKH